jgi:hypothetical protein
VKYSKFEPDDWPIVSGRVESSHKRIPTLRIPINRSKSLALCVLAARCLGPHTRETRTGRRSSIMPWIAANRSHHAARTTRGGEHIEHRGMMAALRTT